jgi:hypothetical protein
VRVCRQLQDARLRDQQRPTDSVDQLMTGLMSGSPRRSNSDNCVQVTDTITHSSVQSECPQLEMTAHLFNYNGDPVQQYVVSSGGETSLQFEDEQCAPSLTSCAEEELNCHPLQKSSVEHGVTNVQQLHLREQCVFTGNVKQKGDTRDGALLSRKNMQHDFLAGNKVNGNCVQEMAEEINETYTEFADGIATGSNVGNCTSTHSIGNQNTNAAHNMECMGDAEMIEVESLDSEIIPASEVDIVGSSDKFSVLTQEHLRDTGISDSHKAETLVFSDDNSDASTVIINSHDSMSKSVHAGCESYCADQDDGSSDLSVVECTNENEDLECHSAELHSSNIGYKQKFASG